MKHLKPTTGLPDGASQDTADMVQIMLARIAEGGEYVAREYAQNLDRWSGPICVGRDDIEAAKSMISDDLRDAIDYAHANILAFAQAQRATLSLIHISEPTRLQV